MMDIKIGGDDTAICLSPRSTLTFCSYFFTYPFLFEGINFLFLFVSSFPYPKLMVELVLFLEFMI